jgi:hypothetical protein
VSVAPRPYIRTKPESHIVVGTSAVKSAAQIPARSPPILRSRQEPQGYGPTRPAEAGQSNEIRQRDKDLLHHEEKRWGAVAADDVDHSIHRLVDHHGREVLVVAKRLASHHREPEDGAEGSGKTDRAAVGEPGRRGGKGPSQGRRPPGLSCLYHAAS